MITGVVPSPPPVITFMYIAHRVQHPLIVDFSSSVANSRSRAFRESIGAQEKVPRKIIRESTRGYSNSRN